MSVSLNNSKDLIVNSLQLVEADGTLKNVKTLITESTAGVVGLPPATLNTIEAVAAAIDNNPNYFSDTQTAINGKADKSTTYLKSEVDAALLLKANSTDVTTLLADKANKASPAFTGTVSGVTKSMVGLGNVDNTSDVNKPISSATQTALNDKVSSTQHTADLTVLQTQKAPLNNPSFTGTVTGITKSMVGLGNVNNTSDASKPISTATQTALNLKAPKDSPAFTGTVTGITKSMVGLGNVNNTADADKPISAAMQLALNDKINSTDTYTKAQIDTTIANIIDNAPAALNTLNELAAALGDDANYATTIQNQLLGKANTTDTFAKSVVSTTTYMDIDSNFRILFDSFTNKVIFQKYDSDGTVVTNDWVTIAEYRFDTNTNLSALWMNGADMNATLAAKADASNVYDKTGMDALLGAKAFTTDVYTITAMDTLLAGKQNKLTYAGTVPPNSAWVVKENTDRQRKLAGDPSIIIDDTQADWITIGVDTSLIATVANLADKAPIASPTFTGTVSGVTKAMVGLGNVDNTSDAAKPVSAAQQAALNDKAFISYVDAQLLNKQDNLAFISPGIGSKLSTVSETSVKGLSYSPPLTMSDDGSVITYGLDSTAYLSKTSSGAITYCNFNSKSRIGWDDTNNAYLFQYFDDEGALQTDSWGNVFTATINTETNVSSMLVANIECDRLTTTSDVLTDVIQPNVASDININGDVVINGSITVNGDTNTFYHVAGRISSAGAILSSKGAETFTVNKTATGVYEITMPAHPDGANYVFLISGGAYHNLVENTSNTLCKAVFRDSANVAVDVPFNFLVLA